MEIKAFKAKDGSIHSTETQQQIHDLELRSKEITTELGNELFGLAEYSDDYRGHIFNENIQVIEALQAVLPRRAILLQELSAIFSQIERLRTPVKSGRTLLGAQKEEAPRRKHAKIKSDVYVQSLDGDVAGLCIDDNGEVVTLLCDINTRKRTGQMQYTLLRSNTTTRETPEFKVGDVVEHVATGNGGQVSDADYETDVLRVNCNHETFKLTGLTTMLMNAKQTCLVRS